MDNTRIFVYKIKKRRKAFDYFSVFDNNLINNTSNELWQRNPISMMEHHLLKNNASLSQDRRWFTGMFLPLKKLIEDTSYTGQYLLLDFSNSGIRLKYIDQILSLPDRYDVVYFYQMGQNVAAELIHQFQNMGFFVTQIQGGLFSVQKALQRKDILFAKDDNMKTIIHQGLSRLVFNEVYSKAKKIEYIYSSNVYSNHYINMRQIFSNSNISMLVTTRLLHMMMDVSDLEFDAFICASITGACIASYLSVYIKKPVLFLRNVGPDIKTEDDLIVERIYPHKKYVYIFDFMCLGTEYLRTKLICALKNSSIIKSFGVSYYKKPARETNNNIEKTDDIQTIFFINHFIPDYYICSVNKDDLE